MKGFNLKTALFNAWGYIVILLLSAGYVATCVFTLGDSGKPLDEIVSEGVLYLLLGVTLSRLFTSQGIMNGMRDELYIATVSLHGATVTEIEPYIDRLEDWCARKSAEALASARRAILLTRGLKYEQCFSPDGTALGCPALPERPLAFGQEEPLKPECPPLSRSAGDRMVSKTLKKRKRDSVRNRRRELRAREKCYRRALTARVYPLCAVNLTGAGTGNPAQPYDFGDSLTLYANRTMLENMVWRLISTVVFSFFGIKLADNFSWEELIFRLAQLAVALGLGVFSMYQAYMHVVEEQRGHITKKIDFLKMFEMYVRHTSSAVADTGREGDAYTVTETTKT